jgi:hypothetical protein
MTWDGIHAAALSLNIPKAAALTFLQWCKGIRDQWIKFNYRQNCSQTAGNLACVSGVEELFLLLPSKWPNRHAPLHIIDTPRTL